MKIWGAVFLLFVLGAGAFISQAADVLEISEPAGKTADPAAPDVTYPDADGRLRRIACDDETMAILSFNAPLHVVSGNDDTFVQTRYNERGQLVSRAVWKVPASETTGDGEAAAAYREALRGLLTEYFYSSASTRPEKRLVISPDTQEETFYLADGREARRDMYTSQEDGGRDLVLRTNYRYDSQKRLTGTDKIDYAALAAAPAAKEEIRYQYTEKSRNADFERLLDNTVVMKTEYETDSAYTETRYFDFGFSVETTYQNGVRTLERFMQEGTEIRRQDYGN
ncbi:MAG: hypothetical protein LBS97_06065 [Treponema sp.]|jgi:hypothetical protein|nr:hypothetical protein [Treponema sp.]